MTTLGNTYTDSITGFKGIATSRTVYLNGCVHVALQGKVGKDGTIPKLQFFDENQLEPKVAKRDAPGGPGEHSPGLHHPE